MFGGAPRIDVDESSFPFSESEMAPLTPTSLRKRENSRVPHASPPAPSAEGRKYHQGERRPKMIHEYSGAMEILALCRYLTCVDKHSNPFLRTLQRFAHASFVYGSPLAWGYAFLGPWKATTGAYNANEIALAALFGLMNLLYPSAQDLVFRRSLTAKAKKRLVYLETVASSTIMRSVREETMDHTDLGSFPNFIIRNMFPHLPIMFLAGLVIGVREVTVHERPWLECMGIVCFFVSAGFSAPSNTLVVVLAVRWLQATKYYIRAWEYKLMDAARDENKKWDIIRIVADANSELAQIIRELNYNLGPIGKNTGPIPLAIGSTAFVMVGVAYQPSSWAWPVGIGMALYIGFFMFMLLFYFAGVGDAYYHCSKMLLSDTTFITAVFCACEGKGKGAEGHAEAVLAGIKDADVAFRMLGTVSLDYHVVVRMFGSTLLAIGFAIFPMLISD
ncbi:hypothetical protein TrCOL_g4412 [Triparma columacea]|uniref:Uncharacterized protein n=1 Tax=Triparma columacea TaxID=722753 RepID=A0A9W7L6J9_9STRA|nr:hypothetical protein TrCOL_g4412 [Triparma columacea]